MHKIPCTVGILSYNAARDLPRALESVKDFAEIIVADGGSTDDSVALAEKAGAKVILQTNPGHPITDFARERNALLAAAGQEWFFYLDADEAMSPWLRDEIRRVTESENGRGAYRVRYLKTSADVSRIYRTFREYYQVRFFRTDRGVRFERAVHERAVVPAGVAVGQLEGPWYVPLDEGDLQLKSFARKAWARTAITAQAWRPRGGADVVHKLLLGPLADIAKSLVKIVGVKIKWGKEAIPLKYELLRVLYTCMQWVRSAQRFLSYLWKPIKNK